MAWRRSGSTSTGAGAPRVALSEARTRPLACTVHISAPLPPDVGMKLDTLKEMAPVEPTSTSNSAWRAPLPSRARASSMRRSSSTQGPGPSAERTAVSTQSRYAVVGSSTVPCT